MTYKTVTCPKGHKFSTHVYYRDQKIKCPHCKDEDWRASQALHPDDVTLSPTTFFTDTSYTSPSSDPAPSFSSGGGGQFDGGGATGSWGSDSSTSSD